MKSRQLFDRGYPGRRGLGYFPVCLDTKADDPCGDGCC